MKTLCPQLDDLGADGIELILSLAPADRGEAIAPAIADFLERIGGMENARLAIALLRRLEAAR